MAFVAGDDEIGVCGDGGGDDVIIVGIVGDHARDDFRLDDAGDGHVVGQHLAWGGVGLGEVLSILRPCQNLDEFTEQFWAGEEGDVLALAKREE